MNDIEYLVGYGMVEWLTGTTVGKFIWAFLISMVPIIELRGGRPCRHYVRPAVSAGLSGHCAGQHASGSVHHHLYPKDLRMASAALALDEPGCDQPRRESG